MPDPHGEHLLVLADGPPGYAALARAISLGHLAGEKGSPQFGLRDLAAAGAGKWWALTGCRKGCGAARAGARRADAPPAASWGSWSSCSGATACSSSCGTTATRSTRSATTPWPSWPTGTTSTCVATNNVHYATPAQRRLATALGRGARPAQPRRARPVAAGGHHRPPAQRRRAGAPLRPLPRRGRARRRDRPGSGLRPVARRPEPAAVPVPRRARRDELPAPPRRRGGGLRAATAPTRSPRRGARSTTSWP